MSTTNFEKVKNKIVTEYVDDLDSIVVIAERYDTYTNKIRRLLIKEGVSMRSKSESQKIALETGRHDHPTKGKERSEKDKIKISESIHGYWSNISEAEYKKRSETAKENWDKMSEKEKSNLQQLAGDGIRRAAKEGSKIELFLMQELKNLGINVVFHKKGLIKKKEMELDLFIPHIKMAIEIDGPSHFLPIWGEESLKKHLKADAEKNGLLLGDGYKVIRVKNLAKRVTEKLKRDILSMVVGFIKDVESGKNKENYFEMELE